VPAAAVLGNAAAFLRPRREQAARNRAIGLAGALQEWNG
jgi:hypothetical protein